MLARMPRFAPLNRTPRLVEEIRMSLSSPPGLHGLARLAVAGLTTAAATLSLAAPASAATTTLYASPTGSGTACSSEQPCSLSQAQTAVRAIAPTMSGDIVVQLGGGTYALSSPLT